MVLPSAPEHDPRRARRPMLLALVYGVFLVLIGITASALVAVVSTHLSSAMLGAVVSRDGALVELHLDGLLKPADLAADGFDAARTDQLATSLQTLIQKAEIGRIDVTAPDGSVRLSSQLGRRSDRIPLTDEMRAALAGRPSASVHDATGNGPSTVQEYLPLLSASHQLVGVVAIQRDATAILGQLDAARRDVMVVTLGAAAALALILFAVFRAAQRRISRQQQLLLEAERRDPLTDLLNHGAVVGLLTDALEKARASGGRLGVVLLDIDNFRLLNETHGHTAGDQVLLRVAALLVEAADERSSVARYGPDEFLLIRTGAGKAEMVDAVERLRSQLSDVTVQFGESEQLPVTVSAGICLTPDDADAVTELLAVTAVALGEAKASGGDTVRFAATAADERISSGSFDVLRGLVIAVDTKDRYTKRHSEDVARYAVFLAERLGLDPELRRTIHLAGLLHDVGKIGIPDTLLRKPGKLTAQEYAIFKQHVALGDAIVRDVPNVDNVRAGIRFHHERWDGDGYLDGLEGEEIPLIGRVLAVADAFSAMTTTRPYRKALSVQEALKRLADAAGTQLQEALVAAFITGIETDADAPLPGTAPSLVWRPESLVA